MRAGEHFSNADRYTLDEAIRKAERASRVEFSVFAGNAEGDPRAFAQALHRALAAPDRSVLIMVDPARRVLEIVTGSFVRRTLSDQSVEIAALHMQADFAAGDLVDGLRRGIQLLAEATRAPQTLHAAD